MDIRTPGTWHDSKPDEQVASKVAKAAWAQAAAGILESVASSYGASITYTELKDRLFDETGYRTRALMTNWIGGILGAIQEATMRDGRPPLSALVVLADTGGVGEGYVNHDQPGGFTDDAERQQAAAEDRLTCYRRFGSAIPAGAAPAMTDLWAAKKAARTQPAPAPIPVCRHCFIALPATGLCDCT